MADRQFNVGGTLTAPADWLLPASLEVIPKTAFAKFDGSGASVAWVPCLRIISDSGHVAAEAVASTSVPAGGSADVTWFPWWRGVTKAAPAPSPNPLGTVWAWWDFSDTSTITADGSGNIVTIKDKTGNGHDAAAPAVSQRPAQSTLNALNCGLFNSAALTVLVASGWTATLASPYTYFVVWTQTVASSALYQPGPVGGWEVTGDDSPAILFDNFDNTRIVMEAGAGSILKPLAAPYTQHQATLIFNDGTSTFRLDGAATGGTTNEKPITNVALGAAHWPPIGGGVVSVMDGKIGEVLIYQGALSSTQYANVEAYLKAKWGTP